MHFSFDEAFGSLVLDSTIPAQLKSENTQSGAQKAQFLSLIASLWPTSDGLKWFVWKPAGFAGEIDWVSPETHGGCR